MSDPKFGCGCGSAVPAKKVLVFACSGGANVAEISDRAARQFMKDGRGSMFCLAGLGAEIPNMIQTARDADVNLVIDGCPIDCARKIFEKVGLTNTTFIRVTDLGIEKKKGEPITEAQVACVVEKCKQAIAFA